MKQNKERARQRKIEYYSIHQKELYDKFIQDIINDLSSEPMWKPGK